MAQILGVPFDEVPQTALIRWDTRGGTDFRRAPRDRLTKVHWDAW